MTRQGIRQGHRPWRNASFHSLVEAAFGTANVRRQRLMRRLSYFLQLARAAVTLLFFVNGSFVTVKPDPGDVDAVCLVPEGWPAEARVAAITQRIVHRLLGKPLGSVGGIL